jgi:nucleotide-binding universal stress UspA family protein
MFKHLLVPIDGSPTSQLAVDKAIGLAQAFSSAVSVLYVIDPYPFTGVGADFAYGQTQYLGAARAEANEALAQARKAFEAAGVRVSASLVEAHAVWRGITEAAEAGGADLIVMGSMAAAASRSWCWAAWRSACCRMRTSRCWSCAADRRPRAAAVSGFSPGAFRCSPDGRAQRALPTLKHSSCCFAVPFACCLP